MRKMKFFLSLVVVLLLCTSLTACAGEEETQRDAVGSSDYAEIEEVEPTDENDDDGGQAERDRRAQEQLIREGHEQAPVDDAYDRNHENDDGGQAERDRRAQEQLDRERQERQQQSGQYRHEVGGATFYTEHDLSKYIIPDPEYPDYLVFDIETMLTDIWCCNGGGFMENKVGYSYSDGENANRGLWFDVPDPNNEHLMHMATIWREVDGVEYKTSIRMYDCPRPDGGYYSMMSNLVNGIHPDLAPLILFALEQMESNPRNGALDSLPLGDNFYCN